MNRRDFVGMAGLSALVTLTPNLARGELHLEEQSQLETGNGAWRYRVVPGWGLLPPGREYGGTHGAIASDKAGLIYVSTQSHTGILVYTPEGQLLKNIATDYPEVHSIHHTEEAGVEYFYVTVQTGTARENWLFLKMKTDGTVVQKITAPPEAGFHAPNEWRLTAAVCGPDQSVYIANGYGDSRIFRFDRRGNYKMSFAGAGSADGKCDCSHGLAIDMRYDQPLLLVCDRENRRLTHFDFDGRFVRNIALHLRRPCQVSFYQDYMAVSELEGRVTLLDKDNVAVAFLGDNPDERQWANYKLRPHEIAPAVFSAAHGCHVDQRGDLYVSDWNKTGRVTKLKKVATERS